jgi:hypothetical protein
VIWRAEISTGLLSTVTVSDNSGSTFVPLAFVDIGSDTSGIGAAIAANVTGKSGHIVTIAHGMNVYLAAKIFELGECRLARSLPGQRLFARVLARDRAAMTFTRK